MSKIFFDRTPKGVGKVCLKFSSQCRQASFPNSALCIANVDADLVKHEHRKQVSRFIIFRGS